MKLNVILLLLVITAGAGWTYYYDQQDLGTPSLKQAAYFTFETWDGQSQSLTDYKGNVTLIHFWATWCAPCLVEFPTLIDLATEEDVTILAIAVQDDASKIESFLQKIEREPPDNFIIGFDPDWTIARHLYGTDKLPESYLLTPHHEIFRKVIGAEENWNSPLWKGRIKHLQN